MATINSWDNQVLAANVTFNGGTMSIGTDATDNAINIGTSASSGRTVTMGNATAASTTAINCGTGGITVGTSANAHTSTFGSTNTTSSTVIKSGSGNVAINSGLTVDSSGRMTNGVQPCFLAYNSSTRTNQTGNGGSVGVTFDTKVFDIGTNFASNTFTAPVTGKYYFYTNVLLSNVSTATDSYVRITTTAREFADISYMKSSVIQASNFVAISGTCVTNMTAGDTAAINVTVTGQATTVGFFGGGAPGGTYYCGYLIC